MPKTKVYVAGPITLGDPINNVRKAVDAAQVLLQQGYLPFVPQLSSIVWHLIYPNDYETWLEYDLGWVAFCDCLLRLEGESKGADREVALARELNKPIYFDILDLVEGVPRESAECS
jgi:hypothetical protein